MIYEIEIPKQKMRISVLEKQTVDPKFIGSVFKTIDGEYTIVGVNPEDNELFKTMYTGKNKRLLNCDLRWSQLFINSLLKHNGYSKNER